MVLVGTTELYHPKNENSFAEVPSANMQNTMFALILLKFHLNACQILTLGKASSKLKQLSKITQWTSSNKSKIMTKTCLSCLGSNLINHIKAVLLPQANKGPCSLPAYALCKLKRYFASVLSFETTKTYHIFASAVRMGCFDMWQVRADINFLVTFISQV